jgi:hypothetical protein
MLRSLRRNRRAAKLARVLLQLEVAAGDVRAVPAPAGALTVGPRRRLTAGAP